MVTKFDFLHWSMFLNERRVRGERAQASFPNGDWESRLYKKKKSNLAYSYEPHMLRDSFFRIQGKKPQVLSFKFVWTVSFNIWELVLSKNNVQLSSFQVRIN